MDIRAKDQHAATVDGHGDVASTLRKLIGGYRGTFLVHAAAELRLADLLADGPRAVHDLASDAGADATALRRLLLALAELGIVVRAGTDRFALTALGAGLSSDAPTGLAALARYQGHDIIQRSWAGLAQTVRTGRTAFDETFGAPPFDYLAAHPDIAALFHAGMAARTAEHLHAVVAAYDWRAFATLVDVGGGDGTLLTAILATAPEATRGVVFDQPRLADAAGRRIAAAGLAPRCDFVGGDFFADMPTGADAYILKHVLHDWDDDDAIRILTRIRAAAPPHARLLVIETLLPEGDAPAVEAALMDIAMLVFTGGRERTPAALGALFQRSGLRLTRVLPTTSAFSLVEAVPA